MDVIQFHQVEAELKQGVKPNIFVEGSNDKTTAEKIIKLANQYHYDHADSMYSDVMRLTKREAEVIK